ncbi:MAG: FAD-dependent oxidoreductase [Halobacteriaceae archaeon]
MTEVAILGGGIGGLSTAHELVERGFDATVYEAGERFGGKARSFPGPEDAGGAALPAEHGFRFFPGFYQHVTDTMSRIPAADGRVTDHLVDTTEILQASTDRRWSMSTASPETVGEYRTAVRKLFGGPAVPRDEKAYFLNRLAQLLTSCQGRLNGTFDDVSWWEYIRAEEMSEKYKKNVGYGITQSLVALRPERASTRTMGTVYLQLIQGIFDESAEMDSVLDGPTSDVWIDPWTTYLESREVDLRSNSRVTAIESDGRRVTGVRIEEGGTESTVDADYYVVGLPRHVLESLLTPELETAAPSLGGVRELEGGWMNGVQFYLEEDVELADGHGIYFDSPWALTTISQRQFWESYDVAEHEGVDGVLSVCISNWNAPGIRYGKPARECTREEIRDEVVAQLEAHLDGPRGSPFSADLVREWHLDPAIGFDDEGVVADNAEPLFINTVGSLRHRPAPATEAGNLLVATDYARTNSDIASMESANEAARRAVNAIVDRSGAAVEPCGVWQWTLPPKFEGLRSLDGLLYRGGLPHPGSVTPILWAGYSTVRSGLGRSGR